MRVINIDDNDRQLIDLFITILADKPDYAALKR